MKNTLCPGLLLCGFLLFLTSSTFALERNGRVVQIKDNRVAVEVRGGNPFEAGQEIDLSYMAGLMEMLIGRYKVYKIKGNLFAAQAVSLSMPPSQDMNVRIVTTQKGILTPDTGAMDPPERDPRFLEANKGQPAPEGGMASLGVKALPQPGNYWFGVEVDNLGSVSSNGVVSRKGVRVTVVYPQSPADVHGMKLEDIIYRANGIEVEDILHFVSLVRNSGGIFELEIERDGKILKQAIPLEEIH